MRKVLLIDDEYYFRQALKATIPWEANGLCVCGEARDGEEALGLLDALAPDIALVDINMPVMDGLAFARAVHDRHLPIRLVILSGHSEFDYARQAVALGVVNYLLKPVDDDELVRTLVEVSRQLDREERVRIETDQLTRQFRANRPLLRDRLLNELLSGQADTRPEVLEPRMASLDMRLGGAICQAAVAEPDAEMAAAWTFEDRQLWNHAIANLLDELLGGDLPHEICQDEGDRICVLATCEASMADRMPGLLADRLEQARDCVQRMIGHFTITIGIGEPRAGLEQLPASYREALIALKSRISAGGNQVIPFATLGNSGLGVNPLTPAIRARLLMQLRALDAAAARDSVAEVFRLARVDRVGPELLLVCCMDLVSAVLAFLTETGISQESVFPGAPRTLVEQAQAFRLLHDMAGWADRLVADAVEAVSAQQHGKSGHLVGEVHRLVAAHCGDEALGIDFLAKRLFVHYSHLCYVFRKETGSTINEYITGHRMEKARILFDGGNRSVSDVADRVGYADANYFGKLFKKHYGVTPSRYVESLGRNG